MPLKNLLVCFARTAAGYARADLAFNLARASRAYFAGAYVLPEMPVPLSGSAGFGLALPAGITGRSEEGLSPGGVVSGALRGSRGLRIRRAILQEQAAS